MATSDRIRCQACGTEFDSTEQLEQHNKREHAHEAQPKSPLSTETSSPRREDVAPGSESVE
ncbi:MAG TPA: hypothetical protein VH638_00110 [Gemmatimonadaceae bacterium]|jgi:hypothetical protein